MATKQRYISVLVDDYDEIRMNVTDFTDFDTQRVMDFLQKFLTNIGIDKFTISDIRQMF